MKLVDTGSGELPAVLVRGASFTTRSETSEVLAIRSRALRVVNVQCRNAWLHGGTP